MKRVITLLVVCTLLFCGCANTAGQISNEKVPVDTVEVSVAAPNAPKNEEQMLADLAAHPYFEKSMGLDSLKVIKRQTRQEDLTDVVYVTVKSHDEKVEAVKSYVLTYNLYNEGWILDNVSSYSEGENSVKPLAGPDDSAIDMLFQRYNVTHDNIYYDPPYSEWTIVERNVDLDGRTASFVVDAVREVPLCVRRERMTVDFCFWDDIFWCEASTIPGSDVVYTLDRSILIRDYYAEDDFLGVDPDKYTLSITDVDEENRTITLYASIVSGYNGYIQEWEGTFDYTVTNEGEWNDMLLCELDGIWSVKIYPYSIYLSAPGAAGACMFDAKNGVN